MRVYDIFIIYIEGNLEHVKDTIIEKISTT